MNRRNITTAIMAVGAVVLLYTGVAMAREPEKAPVLGGVAPRATQLVDDHGGDRLKEARSSFDDRGNDARATESADDRGNDAVMPTASPSFDDHGKDARETESADDRGDDAAPATASPSFDDRGNEGQAASTTSPDDRGNDANSPSASPDDRGNEPASSTASPTASNAATSPTVDDRGHDGGGHH